MTDDNGPAAEVEFLSDEVDLHWRKQVDIGQTYIFRGHLNLDEGSGPLV